MPLFTVVLKMKKIGQKLSGIFEWLHDIFKD